MESIDRNTVAKNADLISKGSITCSDLADHSVKAIESSDANIRAWEHFDAQAAMKQAALIDDVLKREELPGSLQGIPTVSYTHLTLPTICSV